MQLSKQLPQTFFVTAVAGVLIYPIGPALSRITQIADEFSFFNLFNCYNYTSIPCAVTLSWRENANSCPLFLTGNFD